VGEISPVLSLVSVRQIQSVYVDNSTSLSPGGLPVFMTSMILKRKVQELWLDMKRPSERWLYIAMDPMSLTSHYQSKCYLMTMSSAVI
jgi:hypothetical protein